MQVFDVGTGVMMGAEGAVKPVAEVLQEGGYEFDKSQYLPGHRGLLFRPDGTMLSFPYNSSSPILYYNKDAFEKAGLDVDNPPARPGPRSSRPPARSPKAARPPAD
jgi:sn-glycerol 3-phosphate transport system substrate-binding protein